MNVSVSIHLGIQEGEMGTSVAVVLTLLVLITGSLWLAIAVHVLIDVGQGLVERLVTRRISRMEDSSAVLSR